MDSPLVTCHSTTSMIKPWNAHNHLNLSLIYHNYYSVESDIHDHW